MKKLLILPGNSPRNQAWGEACAEFFQEQFDEIYLQMYSHWESGEEVIDVPEELDKIIQMVEAGDADTDEWYICAKSVGTLVSLVAVAEDIISPVKCIFFGMPLALAAEELFKNDWSALENFTIPTLVFHNDSDPVADYSFTKEKLTEFGQEIDLVTIEGDSHDYANFELVATEIADFLNQHGNA